MRRIFPSLAFLYIACLPLDSVATQNVDVLRLRPLALDAVADALGVGYPIASPDGKWICYTIHDPHRRDVIQFVGQLYSTTGVPLGGDTAGSSLHVFNVAKGRTISLIGARGETWGASWSPNSRYLAFYSDRTGRTTLWVWDSATEKSRQVSDQIVHPAEGELPAWSADGKNILVKLLPRGINLEQLRLLNPNYSKTPATTNLSKALVAVYTFDPAIPSNSTAVSEAEYGSRVEDTRFLSDLAIINVATGNVRRIAPHSRAVWYAFSPDNQWVAYMQADGVVANTEQPVYDLRIILLKSGVQRTLIVGLLGNEGTSISWSPDSRFLAYQTVGQKADHRIYGVDVISGMSKKLSGPLPGAKIAPLWSANGKSLYTLDHSTGAFFVGESSSSKLLKIATDGSGTTEMDVPGNTLDSIYQTSEHRTYWSPDGGRSMLLEMFNHATGTEAACLFNLRTRRCTVTFHQNMYLGGAPVTGNPRSPISYYVTNSYDPGSIWMTDVSSLSAKRVSDVNRSFSEARLGKTVTIDFTSLNGERLKAALMLPANYVRWKRYPLILFVYGGNMGSQDVHTFGFWGNNGEFNMQVLASRGYAVLDPDIPIHHNQHIPMHDVYDAAMPAIDKAIAMGIADPTKIGVMGQSFGGYNAISLITQSTRFAVAVATSAADTNFFEGYASFYNGVDGTGFYEQGDGDMGCTPWECRDRYLDNSPFFLLDKVRTPLLLECGLDDALCARDGEVFVSLRRLDQEVTLLQYANEGHVLEHPTNIEDFWNRVLAFLGKHLKP